MRFSRRGKYSFKGKACTRLKLIKSSWRLKSLISDVEAKAKLNNKKGLIFIDYDDYKINESMGAKCFGDLELAHFVIVIKEDLVTEWTIAHECIHFLEDGRFACNVQALDEENQTIKKDCIGYLQNMLRDLQVDEAVSQLGFNYNDLIDYSLFYMENLNKDYSIPSWAAIINLFMWFFELEKIEISPEISKAKKDRYLELIKSLENKYIKEAKIAKELIQLVKNTGYKEPSQFRASLEVILNHQTIKNYFNFGNAKFIVTKMESPYK